MSLRAFALDTERPSAVDNQMGNAKSRRLPAKAGVMASFSFLMKIPPSSGGFVFCRPGWRIDARDEFPLRGKFVFVADGEYSRFDQYDFGAAT